MAPKPPPILATPTLTTPELPVLNLPSLPRDSPSTSTLPAGPGTILHSLLTGTRPAADRPAGGLPTEPVAGPSIRVRDSANPPTDRNDVDPWKPYRPPSRALPDLPAPNEEGLRIVTLPYVDLDIGITVRVGWDEATQTYRARRRSDVTPSGPVLYLNNDRITWRTDPQDSTASSADSSPYRVHLSDNDTPPAAKRPRQDHAQNPMPDATHTYINTDHYVWNEHANNHHGYVVMHRKKGLGDEVGPPSRSAFKDDNGLFVGVERSAADITAPAQQLPAWTDRDIWDFYGIHGTAITLFRTEVSRTGKKPQWARPRAQRMEKTYLYDELHRWLDPEMPRETFVQALERFRLSPQQLAEKLEKADLNWKKNRAPDAGAPKPDAPDPAATQPVRANASASTFGNHVHYTWDRNNKTHQGYVAMHRKSGLDDSHGPQTQWAFDDGQRLVNVRRPEYSIHQSHSLRQYWRDIDIWDLYRIEGSQIARFRQEVALNGIQPQWVKPREFPTLRDQLIARLRLWTSSPHAQLDPTTVVAARLRPYNFSTRQLSQLCDELTATGQFNNRLNNDLPVWAETHKRTTKNEAGSPQFEPLKQELQAEIVSLRNQGYALSALKDHLTPAFFSSLLNHVGYRRNPHNCLYRTDIPAMFRADDRTPFELARDNVMLPRLKHPEGTTTLTAVSATFSLKDAVNYARKVDSDALAYDSQRDTTPTNQDDISLINLLRQYLEEDYVSERHSQRFAFTYLLDTRNVEVVPGRENHAFNRKALDDRLPESKTWFPADALEGHISMSSRGFSADRIWLVKSDLSRAAKVTDIQAQYLAGNPELSGTHANAIEERTWTGQLNRHEYDALIDAVAASGKPVLDFPANQEIFSGSIVFVNDGNRPNTA
jgi:hypothetical protein